MDFNLLISCPRGKEPKAKSEAAYFISNLGDEGVAILKTRFSGLLTGKTSLDPFLVVKKAREDALNNPWDFRYVTKMVPISKVCNSDTNTIGLAIVDLLPNLKSCNSFRITVIKRGSNLDSKNLIDSLASLLSIPVNLKNPSCVILVEVLGEYTGISIIAEPIFSIQRSVNASESLVKI